MKHLKRLAALNLVLVMLLTLFPVSVFAATLTTDQTTTYVVSDISEPVEHTYQAPKTARYTITLEEIGGSVATGGNLSIYDSAWKYQPISVQYEGTKAIYKLWMLEGETYRIQHYVRIAGTYEVSISMEEVSSITDDGEIHVDATIPDIHVTYQPTVSGWYTFYATIEGSLNVQNLTEDSEDYSKELSLDLVYQVDESGRSAYLDAGKIYALSYHPYSEGEATLSVKEAVFSAMQEGTEYVTLEQGQYHSFTPTQDGNYIVELSQTDVESIFYLLDVEGTVLTASENAGMSWNTIGIDLYAGQTYYICYNIPSEINSRKTFSMSRRGGLSRVTENSGYCGSNLQWVYDSATETLNLTGTGAMYDYGVSIWMDRNKMLSAPWSTFRYNIQTVQLPDGLTNLGKNSFASLYMKQMDLPDGVSSIAYGALQTCTQLQEISMPTSLVKIDDAAFRFNDDLSEVYYAGTEEQWNTIDIGINNEPLTNAKVHFGSTGGGGEVPVEADITWNDLVKYVYYTGTLNGIYTLSGDTALPNGLNLVTSEEKNKTMVTGVPLESGTHYATLVYTTGEDTVVKMVIDEPISAPEVNKTDSGYEWENNPSTDVTIGDDLVLISRGEFSEFLDVYLNGRRLTKDVEYKAEEGSTKITIFSQTMQTAGLGTHTISATFQNSQDGTIKRATHTVTVETEQSTGGGSWSGGSSSSSASSGYRIAISPEIKHGTVTLSHTRAEAGDEVTITPKADVGYEVVEVIVKGANGEIIPINKVGDVYRFEMPKSAITVYATFDIIKGAITVNTDETQGTVVLKNNKVAAGERVEFTVQPKGGYLVADVSVLDSAGTKVDVERTDGVYAFIMPEGEVRIDVTFQWKLPFGDVTAESWFWDKVDYVYQKGLMVGVADNQFLPNGVTTRGMVVTTLYQLAGRPTVSGDGYTDVEAGAYYANPVIWASELGIVQGYGDGTFGPNDIVTREQLTNMVYRYIRALNLPTYTTMKDLSDFVDGNRTSDVAMEAMLWACQQGMITGQGNQILNPQGQLTRAELATILKWVDQYLGE